MSEFYEEQINTSTSSSNRYKDCNILIDKETGESLLATREVKYNNKSNNDQYHRLKSHEVGRLDLIAYNYYKNPLLWWVIAQANDIYDPFQDIAPGTLLRIPSLESLYGYRGILT